MDIFVRFKDESEKEIVSVFACEQAEGSYENLGSLADSDPRYSAFYNALDECFQLGMVKPEPLEK